jgi:hypothetical protein
MQSLLALKISKKAQHTKFTVITDPTVLVTCNLKQLSRYLTREVVVS